MEFTYLDIQIPQLSDEQAAVFQQFFYAFMDAFDLKYRHAIEDYYQAYAQQQREQENRQLQMLKELLSKDNPF